MPCSKKFVGFSFYSTPLEIKGLSNVRPRECELL